MVNKVVEFAAVYKRMSKRDQDIVLIEMYNMNSYNYGSTIEAVSVHWRQLALLTKFV